MNPDMYQRIWKDYRTTFFKQNPRLPREKSFSIGRALWAISRQKRMKFIQIATKTGLDEGTILRMSSSHKMTSSPERIRILAEAVGVTFHEFLRSAREEYYGNFFITKARMPSEKEIREYARHGLSLQKQTILRYPDSDSPDFRVICHSPPVESLVDFFAATIIISPGKRLSGCWLPRPTQLHLAVINGAVQVDGESGEKIEELVAGQEAHFNGNVKHAVINLSSEREAGILLALTPTQILAPETVRYAPPTKKDWDIPSLIEEIRRFLSPDPQSPIPLSDIALLAGLSLWELGQLSKGHYSNLPIDKMERLAQLLHVPFEALLQGVPFQRRLHPRVTRGTEKGICDFRTSFGVTFYPWIKPGDGKKKLFLGKADLESRHFQEAGHGMAGRTVQEKIWEGKSEGYILAKGISGKLGVGAGERHNYPDIDRDDTAYLDMSLGFSFRSFSPAEPTSFFLVSAPPLF